MLTEPCADFIQAGHLSMSPPEYGMNLTNSIEAALAFEQDRREVPDGYPNLPDLPLARYNAPQLYRQEFATVWRRSWLFAGHTTELPQVGSYRVPDIPFAPVLLVRGEDGAIRAFLNACRHRGAPFVEGCSGRAGQRLVCGFHSWAYDLQGKLVGVTERRDFSGWFRKNDR
jgi:nitrite reductase/ring-hydroxylating ferredoxin subunit